MFTACCYTKSPANNDVRNDIIVVTENSDHDRVASMSCLQKVVHKIEHMHVKRFMFGAMKCGLNLDLTLYLNY